MDTAAYHVYHVLEWKHKLQKDLDFSDKTAIVAILNRLRQF